MKSRLIKAALTVLGAIVFSTLGIYAADSLQGIGGGIGQFAGVKKSGICMDGSVPITVDGRILCVDEYEASPSLDCPHTILSNTVQSEENASTKNCYASSVAGKVPWNFISLPQAQRMCGGAGKRLPTSEEWYHIALGTDANTCTIQTTAVEKTGNPDCTSSIGAYDVVGNVWEWVDEEVHGNVFNERILPDEGYVSSVDSQGVALESGGVANNLYGKDYIWSKSEGVFGMLRGGFYGSGQDAGLYTVNASVQTSFATQGVGFRCVKDVFN
jgi:formylglycine-generating enzyme required for sulfatase activity